MVVVVVVVVVVVGKVDNDYFCQKFFNKMRRFSSLIGVLILFLACSSPTDKAVDRTQPMTRTSQPTSRNTQPATPPPDHRQFLLSITPDWDAVNGKLYLIEWKEGKWEMNGQPIPMVVGKRGMAWGRGIEDFTNLEGPIKREGDKKSPAGIFELGTAFGYAAPSAATFVKANYTHVVSTTMCIEDGASARYNQIIDENSEEADWNSTDHMLRKDDLYEWGMFVLHNQPTPLANAGSCIFLHVWRKNDSGTAGCTAMDKQKMKEILSWVDPSSHPLMIQVPAFEYERFRKQYDLPNL